MSEATMEASEDHKTSKTRASTPASNGQLAVANWSPSPAANSEQGAKLTASSTEISTESDSEKDAAEAYNGAGSHQTGVTTSKPQGTNRKRGAPPCTSGPPKRLQHSSFTDKTTPAESEAIAVLEHFKDTELKSKPKGVPRAVEDGAAKSSGPQLPLPFSAIQNLARLIEEQRRQSELSMQSIRASPFQGRPVSPPKADPKTSSELAMRHCFSEGSANGLGALSKQDGTALALLQSITASNQALRNQASKTGLSTPDGTANLALTNAIQALDKAAPSFNTFNTHNSSTATDTTFDINAFLSHTSKKTAPAALNVAKETNSKVIEPSSSPKKPLLGAFGSLIPDAPEKQLHSIGSHKRTESSPNQLGDFLSSGLSGDMSKAKGFSALKSAASDGRPLPHGSHHLPASAGLPDPQILEWIVGNCASLTDKGKGSLDGSNIVRPVAEKIKLPVMQVPAPEARPITQQDSKTYGSLEREGSTLRRPIAIRPREYNKDAAYMPATPSEGSLEALLSRMHSSATTTASPRFSPLHSIGHQPPPAPAPTAVAASDLGRVMHWAGTELSLRDQKVREVQRLRQEDRRAHDATLSAVAADVSRLKFGQAQLVKAHRQYQEALTQKDKALQEKDELITGLTRALSELRQQLQRHGAEKQSSDCQGVLEENPLPATEDEIEVPA